MNITLLGAGAWGTALAIHFSRLNHRVTLVPRRMETAMELRASLENSTYLPGFKLDPNMQIGVEIGPSIMEADIVFLAYPSFAVRYLAMKVKENLSGARNLKAVTALCKGLEKTTLSTPCQILTEIFPDLAVGVLSGPNFANEVAAGLPAATVFAMPEKTDWATEAQKAFSSDGLRVYVSSDVTGVELGGCLKNMYAIGAGICQGLSLGYNAKAAYMTRALHELVRLGVCMGGQPETFYGLSGFGDLIATCEGPDSRNRTFGEHIAQGQSIESLLSSRKTVVEGYAATRCFYEKVQKSGINAPILTEIYNVLYSDKDPREAVTSLMTRELKIEAS